MPGPALWFALTLLLLLPAGASALDRDARRVDFDSLRRLALQAGRFAPVVQPVPQAELDRLLEEIEAAAAREGNWSADDLKLLRSLRSVPQPGLSAGAAGIVGYSELGDPVAGEAGLALAPGWSAAFEPDGAWSRGRAWAAVAPRWSGRLGSAGVEFTGREGDPLAYPRWPYATGRETTREARLRGDAGELDLPRAMVGRDWDAWSFSAGVEPRRTGPALDGALGLDLHGEGIPAATLRRTRPFVWSGPLARLDPEDLLLRCGLLSERTIRYVDDRGETAWRARPWFFQWLLGWQVTSWLRIAAEHQVMAATDDGTLWPDLLQINFPLKGTTWRESESGPVTDRIFDLQLEARWPPAAVARVPVPAGRVWWQYGGTDFLPSGPGGLIPEISAPASVVGVELVSPRWDAAVEFAELEHDRVLWYSNGGFPEGYTQDGWLLGHPLGGAGRSWSGEIRHRPAGRAAEVRLRGQWRRWRMERVTPGRGERTSLSCTWRRLLPAADRWRWQLTAEWNREEVDPQAFVSDRDGAVRRDWVRVLIGWSLR